MRLSGFVVLSVIGASLAWGASDTTTVDQAAARLEQVASQSPASVQPLFRVYAAEALKDHHPELAAKFVRSALADAQARDGVNPELLSALTEVAPEEAIALLPHLKPGSDRIVEAALLRSNHVRQAAELYRASLAKGQAKLDMPQLFKVLASENPVEAKKLFADTLAAFSYDAARPMDFLNLINCAQAVAPFAPDLAAGVYDRVVTIASAPDFGKNVPGPSIRGTFQAGPARIETRNLRNTLLVMAGSRLHAVAPDRFEKHKDVLSAWNLTVPLKVSGMSFGGPAGVPDESAAGAISERMGKLRSLSDADRPKAVLELARTIEALPKGSKFGLASGLASLATEGDNGKEAMDAVAAALGQGIQEGEASARAYIELAKLIRYEHARAPFSDPSLDAADALLTLRARVYQDNGFSLVSMDGKTYALDKLRGKIVLLNFWATWCPPCRKEMPDMETLYKRFEKKGLVVLAVSDEDRETVAGYLAKNSYTFPVLLDPGREVNKAFGIEGIPKSFIFDANGKLVSLAIDMRTERQFLDLLKEAGLQ